jgi:hypothetical protein
MVALLWAQRFPALLFFVLFYMTAVSQGSYLQHDLRQVQQVYDIVVYGSTPAAIAAAIQTSRMNKTVALVTAQSRLGGVMTSGLGWTDSKDGRAISGISREFFKRVYTYYLNDKFWPVENRKNYRTKVKAQPGQAIDVNGKVQWTFEPKVAKLIIEDWVREEKITVFLNQPILRSKTGVTKSGKRITSLKTESGTVFRGKMFIDASYEGDLMDVAGIPYHLGRESASEYNEAYAGYVVNTKNRLNADPYVLKGIPASGTVSGIQEVVTDPLAVQGTADPVRLQAYNYRMTLTKNTNNQVPFSKPAGYQESDYELLLRYIENGYTGALFTTQLMPNGKTDTNANGQVSTDLLGGNFNNKSNYMDWSNQQRQACADQHKYWTQGFFWTLANNPRLSLDLRTRVGAWGYAADEYLDNDNFPFEMYIREGRRLDGLYTMKRSDVEAPTAFVNDSIIAYGSYRLDVHAVQRVLVGNNIYSEGQVGGSNVPPFPIPVSAVVPRTGGVANFASPVTMSSTHIAFAAIRMEPTYMMMGQGAAIAAALAIDANVDIQNVDRKKLSDRIKKEWARKYVAPVIV